MILNLTGILADCERLDMGPENCSCIIRPLEKAQQWFHNGQLAYPQKHFPGEIQ
jgi:hypothetical protein